MDYRFQVNLGGIINLLANNLYSGPKVFLRELLQNAVDAIRARELFDPSFAGGRVSIEVIEDAAARSAAAPTLICEDDGVGLTEDEVHRFLATIGESSKRGDLGQARADFIGQFGIGLLSCFMVADEIVVISRSARDPADGAVEWRGRPDGTYTVRRVESAGEPGTRVYLRASAAGRALFDPRSIKELAQRFGGLLPIDVTVTSGKSTWPVSGEPPWTASHPTPRERNAALLEYGQQVFGSSFIDCVPLSSSAGGVRGVAFVLPYSPSPSAKHRHRIYLKRMLLSDAGEGILPDWAFFVRCVINADDLRPTASREGFYEDDQLAAAREALGRALRDYLVNLGRNDPTRLQRVVAIHYLAIKALAIHDEDFCRIFIDWIPFETSMGSMSFAELRDSLSTGSAGERVLRYVPSVDEFRQVARVAAAQDVLVVNAGYTYDEALLQKLPEVFDDLRVQRVGASTLAQSFAELTLDERDGCFELLRAATAALAPFGCSADVRRFEPAEFAALYTTDPDGSLRRAAEQARDLGNAPMSDLIDNILGGARDAPRAHLLMNYDSPLVRRLATLRDRQLLRRCVEMLYVQALMLGHHPLTARELSLMNGGLSALIEAAAAEDPKGGPPPSPPAGGKGAAHD